MKGLAGNKNIKILVTGEAGYIGSKLVAGFISVTEKGVIGETINID